MGLKQFDNFSIQESETKKKFGDLIISEEDLEFLNTKGVGLASKINKDGESGRSIRYQMWGKDTISFNIDLRDLGVYDTIKNLEKFSDCDFLPNFLVRSSMTIRYSVKKDLSPGKYEIGPYFSSNNPPGIINVEIGFDTLEGLAGVINETVNEMFNDFKKVRVATSWDLRKAPVIESYLRREIKTIYSNLIDRFLEDGKMDPKDIDDSLNAILLASSLEENPDEIENFNSLPERSRKELLTGWKSILKEDDLTLSIQKVSAIKKYLSVKKTWDYI